MQTPDARHETTLTPTELYEGVLLGTAIGDAFGLACEGLSAGAIAKRFGRVDRYRLFGSIGWVSDERLARDGADDVALLFARGGTN
ncbi:MAG: ADP-ribosylglycohydrolase family protein [Deltaproteobacteria bacterium]|jgi:ADP-ribosylglycohydrolase